MVLGSEPAAATGGIAVQCSTVEVGQWPHSFLGSTLAFWHGYAPSLLFSSGSLQLMWTFLNTRAACHQPVKPAMLDIMPDTS